MEPDAQPLPAPARRAVRRYDLLTNVVGLLLIFGPIAVPLVVFGRQAVVSGAWPGEGRAAAALLIFGGTPVWFVCRWWRFARVCPCPRCGGRLRAERPGERGTTLLACRACAMTWDSGGGHYESWHPSQGGG